MCDARFPAVYDNWSYLWITIESATSMAVNFLLRLMTSMPINNSLFLSRHFIVSSLFCFVALPSRDVVDYGALFLIDAFPVNTNYESSICAHVLFQCHEILAVVFTTGMLVHHCSSLAEE